MTKNKISIKKFDLMNISANIDKDPVLIESMKLLFDFANRMGRHGYHLNNLTLEEIKSDDPLNNRIIITCDNVSDEDETN